MRIVSLSADVALTGEVWTHNGTGAALTQSTTVHRGTGGSARCSGMTSSARSALLVNWSGSGLLGPLYLRFYLRVATRPSSLSRIAAFCATSPFARRVAIGLTSSGTLQLDVGGVQVGSDSSVLALDTWYRVEMMVNLGAAAGGGDDIVEARLDGSSFASSTTQSVASTIAAIMIGGNLSTEAQSAGDWYFDDIALNDNNDTVNNSWPGTGQVGLLHIDGDGYTGYRGTQATDWDTGPTTGQTAYQQVDEAAADDATSYLELIVSSTGNTNRAHYFDVEDPATALGMGSADVVNNVEIHVRFSQEATQTATFVPLLGDGGSPPTILGGIPVGIGGDTLWYFNNDSTINERAVIITAVDAAGNPWTRSSVQAMRLGIRASDADPDVYISQIFAAVDFTAAAVGSKPFQPGFNAPRFYSRKRAA